MSGAWQMSVGIAIVMGFFAAAWLAAWAGALLLDWRRRHRRPSALQRQLAIEDLDIAAGRAATRPFTEIGDLVVNPELERYYARRLQSLTPGHLCYWCWPPAIDPRAKKAQPTDCICPDWCESAACIAGVRHG